MTDDERERAVQAIIAKHAPTPAEELILRALVDGVPRGCLAREIGKGANTIKSQVHRLLERVGVDTTDDLVMLARAAGRSRA